MPVSIPPFATVPAPGDDVKSAWAQQLTQYAVDHVNDSNDAHDATAISYNNAFTMIGPTDVQGALDYAVMAPGNLQLHLDDTADAHDASAISFVPTGTIAATTVQAAIVEVAAEAAAGGGVADNSITNAKMADNAIATAELADNAVTSSKIAAGQVTDTKIADGHVTTTKLGDASATNAKLANVATNTIKGRVAAGSGVPTDLTPANARAVLASDSGGGTTNFLRADGTWAAPPAGGGGSSGPLGYMVHARGSTDTVCAASTLTDVVGSTVSWTADPTRMYKISAVLGMVLPAGATSVANVFARLTDNSGVEKAVTGGRSTGGQMMSFAVMNVESGLSGTIVRKLRFTPAAGGTTTITGLQVTILVEDIGEA